MKNLYILRHAIAAERGTPGFTDDSQRPLTREGIKKMKKNAEGMKALGLSFDAVLTSPYARAKSTAAIVAEIFSIDSSRVHLTDNLIPDVPFNRLVEELNHTYGACDHLLVVGHEPHLSGLISYLLLGKASLPMDFKKGGLCALSGERLGPKSTTLAWLLPPSVLRAAA